MKNKTIFLVLILVTIIIYSCRKDKVSEPDTTPSTTYPNYSQLKVGNYWIYQEYKVDTLGNATVQNVFDSCYVINDTLLNGKTYHRLLKPAVYKLTLYDTLLLRDSLHYIVNSDGDRLFSSQDFTNDLKSVYFIEAFDTVCKIVRKMTAQNLIVSVQAGTFTTSDAQQTYYMYPAYSSNGSIRYTHTRYAQNVGIVEEVEPFFISLPYYTERRLVRYHLN